MGEAQDRKQSNSIPACVGTLSTEGEPERSAAETEMGQGNGNGAPKYLLHKTNICEDQIQYRRGLPVFDLQSIGLENSQTQFIALI